MTLSRARRGAVSPGAMAMLGKFLRPAKGRKPPLRAKWDHCFESLLDGTLDVSRQPRRWWDDFLLLGVNARLLADTILATLQHG